MNKINWFSLSGLSPGAVAGAAIGGLVGAALLVLLIILIISKIRSNQRNKAPNPDRFNVPAGFSFTNALYDDTTTVGEDAGMKLEDIRGFGPSSSES